MTWLRDTLRDLALDRGRIILVTLGVVWGTLSLAVVLAFGNGFDRAMHRAMDAVGRHLIRIWGGSTTVPHAGLPAGRRILLESEDAPAILARVPGIRGLSVEYTTFGQPLEYRDHRINVRIHGVDVAYGSVRNFVPAHGGRFFNERDILDRRRVIFLGSAIRERLFGDAPGVGEVVKAWGIPFTVVGTMRPRVALSDYEGKDEEKVLIPSSTFVSLTGSRWITYLILGIQDPAEDDRILRGIYEVLSGRHSFDPVDAAALGVANLVETFRPVNQIIAGTQILVAIVGMLGLLVALVGVANVMFVMVEERRREIGIQIALGATPRRITSDRLVEGILITWAGGLIGIAASAGVIWLMNRAPMTPEARAYLGRPVLSIAVTATVAGFLGVAGCVAGYYPARRAARLQPVEVLRDD